MLLFSILLLSAGTAIAQPTPTQSTETEVTQQVQPGRESGESDQDLEKLREACEKALAEAARTEAEGQTPQPIDPACEQFSKEEPADEDADIVIVVTGTRTERSLIDSTAAISVIEREQIEGQQVREIDDLIRYEPGISVSNNLQFGLQDFNIRGVGGNRVLIQVDGIRLPTAFQFGNRFNIAQGFSSLRKRSIRGSG